uniref:Uncharacterized protein n=1 Tax=Helianthus annuus TaxID=4232 RepID=A0A251VHH5_HELAN
MIYCKADYYQVGHAAYEISVSGGGPDVGSWDNSFHNFEDHGFWDRHVGLS